MELLKPLLLGVLVPGAVSLVIFLLASRRRADATAFRPEGALALGFGCLAGFIVIGGWPSRYPVQSTEWIPFIGLAAFVLAFVESVRHVPGWLVWFLRTCLLASVLYFLLRKQLPDTLQLTGMLFAGIALWAVISVLARRLTAFTAYVLLAVFAAGSGIGLVLSGSLLLGQLNGVLAASLAGCALAVSWRYPLPAPPGSVTVIMLPLLALWLCGNFYSELPAISIGLLAAGPVLALLASFAVRGRLASWRAAIVYLVILLIPVVVADIIASKSAEPAASDSSLDAEYGY
jgi:hypothetical protein